ncbi:MAG: lysophospholipid acyltransferase family protein [Candidatus Caldarchaeum sp.]
MVYRGDPFYFFCRFIVKQGFLRALGGVQVLHSHRLPKEGAAILAANHTSFLDPPVVGCAVPCRVRYMAQHELFRAKAFGWLIRRLGAFPVHRGSADISAIRTAERYLSQGEWVLMFPEGRRGDGNVLGPAQKGVALLAERTGAVVVPMGLCHTVKVLPKGAKVPRRHLMRVVIGEPLSFAVVKEDWGVDEARRVFGDLLMGRIAQLMTEGGHPVAWNPSSQVSLRGYKG